MNMLQSYRHASGVIRCGISRGLGLVLTIVSCQSSAILAQSVLLSPEPGTTLPSPSVTFTWQDVGATDYYLTAGTAQGLADLFNSGAISSTTQTVSGLPTQQIIHVALLTRVPNGSSYYVIYYVFNADLDDDGIENAIDPRPGVADARTSFAGSVDGQTYALTLLGSGRLGSLEVAPVLYDSVTSSGATTTTITSLSRMVFQQLRDEFDFIVFVSNEDAYPSGAPAYGRHFSVKNDIAGLNQNLFNLGASFGSEGRLQSAIHLVEKAGIRGGPSLHELMHRWANSSFIPTTVGGHWGFSNVGGQLGGWANGTLQSLGNNRYRANNGRDASFGTFANGGNVLPYSPLELYLMGLIEATEVHDIQYALNAAYTANVGEFTATSIESRTMSQLIAQRGPRLPGVSSSQKSFNVLWVVLTKTPLSNGRWLAFDRDVYDFVLSGDDGVGSRFNFWEATGGRAQLVSAGLQQAVRNPVVPPPTIARSEVQGGNFSVEFTSTAGVSYSLERTFTLAAAAGWPAIVANIPGDGQTLRLTDTSGLMEPSAFYRVRANPALTALLSGGDPKSVSSGVDLLSGMPAVCSCYDHETHQKWLKAPVVMQTPE